MGGERPWLLLDLAGVLLEFSPERRSELIGSLSGLTADAVTSRIEADGITDRLDIGRADGSGLASFLSGVCERSIDEDEAWRIWLSPFSIASAMDAVPALSARYRLGSRGITASPLDLQAGQGIGPPRRHRDQCGITAGAMTCV